MNYEQEAIDTLKEMEQLPENEQIPFILKQIEEFSDYPVVTVHEIRQFVSDLWWAIECPEAKE